MEYDLPPYSWFRTNFANLEELNELVNEKRQLELRLLEINERIDEITISRGSRKE